MATERKRRRSNVERRGPDKFAAVQALHFRLSTPDSLPLHFKASPIHGIGGFARTDLPPGSRIIEYLGEQITRWESLARCARNNRFIFALSDDFDLDGSVEWNPARFLNHSCSPNAEAQLIGGRIWIVGRRAIACGEEITFNYNFDLIDYREHPCRCGAPECVGFIVAEEFFPHLRANRESNVESPRPESGSRLSSLDPRLSS